MGEAPEFEQFVKLMFGLVPEEFDKYTEAGKFNVNPPPLSAIAPAPVLAIEIFNAGVKGVEAIVVAVELGFQFSVMLGAGTTLRLAEAEDPFVKPSLVVTA